MYKFLLQNSGSVQLEFSWQVQMEGQSGATEKDSQGSSRSSSIHSRPSSVLESVTSLLSMGADSSPFSIQPSAGTIPAGRSQEFLIKFSPVEVGDFEGLLNCSIPNLLPGQPEPHIPVR
ncbi:unnamed protein product, partial [Staurois parvus]